MKGSSLHLHHHHSQRTTTSKSPMASSSTPLQIIDDEEDEEFDWEAAVKEIDVACAQTPATSYGNSNPSLKVEETHKRDISSKRATGFSSSSASSSRQSTLDRFIGIASNLNARKSEGEKIKPNFYSNGISENSGNNNNKVQRNNKKSEEEEEDHTEGNISSVEIDPVAAKTWIYPVKKDHQLRDYQFNISRTALFSNTLVALPTGLGKTFIAAVVMYNYFRWFPEGKIVFAAPSRPLVLQQIEACHNIGGIPQEWAIDLTGQTNPTKRAHHWKSKRVFFVTPQVLEKDIYSGSCLVKHLVCLVIDEAHRATGNYSYCVAVRELMAVPVPLRILALTATPGSKQDTIQHIIDNLQISTLEYRDETDPDVKPYVQDRKIDLIEVPMGKDATETNNLILEIIRPYAARLSALGVLPNRDFQTLSPCDLLNSRDQFRQKPPEGLPQMKYGEIEGFFGVLVTLYHVRKLLSSHGIKPAFEMLEEKLKLGSFARLMSRNEGLLKAKLLMQQHISHGAPSPKLSKLMDVLIAHFKRNNPQNSRVIIFSNFRGSVRDIMDALKNIGELVKATEFIGQSSGKSLKGQSQKIQQAVLQKFRAGQYNVIVATSIGEEGLDIMEVDLVICFDANISSLRMIQRMGRTGRKHQGRVVVLACEGSELKGYKRKQANSKTIKKYMRNGGTANFHFHSSPRMIPHCFRPEVQFLEHSVEQFVPRVKRVYDDADVETSASRIKLTDAENNLIAKYFNSTKENIWRPSLIVFPHFQAFPSRVHKVAHSVKTGMLIDAMQLLQGLASPEDEAPFIIEGKVSHGPCSKTEDLKQCIDHKKGELLSEASVSELKPLENISKDDCGKKVLQTDEKFMEDVSSKEEKLAHSFLFVSQLVFIDDLGRVQISSPPQFPLKPVSHSNSGIPNILELQYCPKEDSIHFEGLIRENGEMNLQAEKISEAHNRHKKDEQVESKLSNSVAQQGEVFVADERILQPPVSELELDEEESISDSPKAVEFKTSTFLPDDSMDDPRDHDFSPRLTSYIESGFVPESPINDAGIPQVTGDESMVPDGLHSKSTVKSSQQNSYACQADQIQSLGPNVNNISPACKYNFPTVEMQTPVELQDPIFSEDCLLNSRGKSRSVERKCKFKRLRKLGDLKRPSNCKKQKICQTSKFSSDFGIQQGRGGKQHPDANVFIEEEAEVSSDDMVSDDEEQELERSSYDDSFIDDRTNPTAASTQAEGNGLDMMAVYRRSLLSQSPIQRMPDISSHFTPNSGVSRNGSTGTSEKANHSETPQNGLESTSRKAVSFHLDHVRFGSDAVPSGIIDYPKEHESKMESRKRKSLCQARYLPVQNLESKFLHHSETTRKGSILEVEAEKLEENRKSCDENKILENGDAFEDDQFYDAIDLDTVEEQAAKLLKRRSNFSSQTQVKNPEPMPPNIAITGSPSFDLGI